jgi:hypothetical protein
MKLAAEKVPVQSWKSIQRYLWDILDPKSDALEGGEKPYHFKALHQFMLGRMNFKQHRVMELCMVGNVKKDMNMFRNALDIVEGILELEDSRCHDEQVFVHNVPASANIMSTVFDI